MAGVVAVAAITVLLGELSGLAVAERQGSGAGSESCRRVEANGGTTRVGGLTVVFGKSVVPKGPGMLPYTRPNGPLIAVVGAPLALAGLAMRRRPRGSG